jgi:hypothetical protein
MLSGPSASRDPARVAAVQFEKTPHRRQRGGGREVHRTEDVHLAASRMFIGNPISLSSSPQMSPSGATLRCDIVLT